ncbi:MAG: hypothetical protein R2827_12195 [Bdellovibrionales bacterium]
MEAKATTKGIFAHVKKRSMAMVSSFAGRGKMPLHFIRSGREFGILDQPNFFQHYIYSVLPFQDSFVMVLGDPVGHSWTPSFHYRYFADRNFAVVAISMERDGMDTGNPSIFI